MNLSEEEKVLRIALSEHEKLISDCVRGAFSFGEFYSKYGDFYMEYALDGHEADDSELAVLMRLGQQIAIHAAIWDFILSAGYEINEYALNSKTYWQGRFGDEEALRRLRVLAKEYGLD